MIPDDIPRWILEVAFAIYAVAITALVVVERRKPTATLALVLALVFVPILGLLFYFVFATRRVRRRRRARAQRIVRPVEATREFVNVVEIPDDMPEQQRGLVRLALATSAAPLRRADRMQIVVDPARIFEMLGEAIGRAERYIHLEFYIWRDDSTGRELVQRLSRRARAGVKVRVLVDHVGSFGLPEAHFAPLLDAGGEVAVYGRLRLPMLFMRSRLNYRNHRKIVVIDGCWGLLGGVNVGDEYAGRQRDRKWRDLMTAIEGDAVLGLGAVFLEDWLATTGRVIDLEGEARAAISHIDARRTKVRRVGGRERTRDKVVRANNPFAVLPPRAPASTGPLVQVIPSGPDAPVAEAIAAQISAAIASAQRRAWIVTPYFIPDDTLALVLRTAALRGVDVRIVLPAPAHNDSRLVAYAAASYYDELIDTGCRIYEYESGMLHAKYVIIDDLAAIGSANMDVRSFYINYEIIAMLYDAAVTAALSEVFLEDLSQAREVVSSARDEMTAPRRLAEGVARVLSPLL
jgi:cardiolipin synthase